MWRDSCAWATKLGYWIVGASIPLSALAQPSLPQTISARSLSGQFIVNDERSAIPLLKEESFGTNGFFVRLEPAALTVACERLKQILYRELGETDPWKGKIYLILHSAVSTDDTITLTSERFTDGWQYRLDLPDVLYRERFVRTMTQALLQEIANRHAASHAAELPRWLLEGLTQQILASNEIELLLPPPRANVNGLSVASRTITARREDPIKQLHATLRNRQPLSFEELSWPTEEQSDGSQAELYWASAHLFVHDLLRLEDGRACLRATLAELPANYNWQFAFLRAFQTHFSRPLDVEKWWTLHLAHFAGRDASKMWPLRESLQRLDEILHMPVQVQTAPNQPPLYTLVKLQTVIREWDQTRQNLALTGKLRELEVLRFRVALELTPVVDKYHQALEDFLKNRNRSGSIIPFLRKSHRDAQIEETIAQLDALDTELLNFQTPPVPVASGPENLTFQK